MPLCVHFVGSFVLLEELIIFFLDQTTVLLTCPVPLSCVSAKVKSWINKWNLPVLPEQGLC